jgi:glutamate-1-semialdehyde 2,1-aminomutase
MVGSSYIQKKLLRDHFLRARAEKVIPGGMWGHMSVAALPAGYPQYFSNAKGSRLTDVDGNKYVDFICGYGPIILGHKGEDVDTAFIAQLREIDLANGPSEKLVDLAELMVDIIPAADWAMFSKNGTDATTACVMIARSKTGRRKIAVARGAYHGAAPWCTPRLAGTTLEDRSHLVHFNYNDVNSLEAAVSSVGDDLAGILVSAFRHDTRVDQELPSPAFARAVREIANRTKSALILDDVRAGFRINLGGSWEPLEIHPDLSAWSKALGNGFPIAAVTGKNAYRDAAQQVFVTGSFWCGSAAMAAAHATILKLIRIDAISHMELLGNMLREGIQEQARQLGINVSQTGPVQMPQILFHEDPEFRLGNLFCTTALRHGVYLHPWHNMFLSAAHSETDIELALTATQYGLEAVAAAN